MSPPLLATDGQVQTIGAPTIPHPPSSPEKKSPISRWKHRYLGEDRFPRALSALEIEHFFTLEADEVAAVRKRRSALNGLALALQVGFLRMTGRTLNSVELIPSEVLDHLGRQLDCPPPRLASIRAFYRRRRRILFEHQATALRLLGRGELTPHAALRQAQERAGGLSAPGGGRRFRSCRTDGARPRMAGRARLSAAPRAEHSAPRDAAARRHHEQSLFWHVAAAMPVGRETWVSRLLAPIEEGGISRREWLAVVPPRQVVRGLAEQIEKIGFLKELGADRLALPDLPIAGLEHFAKRMMERKPAALARIKEPYRTIEVACFLRLSLLRLMDGSLDLLDHRIAALWRGARERAEEAQAGRLRRLRQLLGDLAGLADDEALDAAELRARLRRLIAPFEPERQATQVAAVRQELGRKSHDLARLLNLARAMPLAVPAGHPLAVAFATLDSLSPSSNGLPAKAPQPFGPLWRDLLDQLTAPQPSAAPEPVEGRAASLMALKRALRNRSVAVDHSLSHRAPEDRLIPLKLWQR
ncbi:MAG: DUF4158 domain-containing protein, partial [Acetobacteraceae bacterium]